MGIGENESKRGAEKRSGRDIKNSRPLPNPLSKRLKERVGFYSKEKEQAKKRHGEISANKTRDVYKSRGVKSEPRFRVKGIGEKLSVIEKPPGEISRRGQEVYKEKVLEKAIEGFSVFAISRYSYRDE